MRKAANLAAFAFLLNSTYGATPAGGCAGAPEAVAAAASFKMR